jgi:hypothetical protein
MHEGLHYRARRLYLPMTALGEPPLGRCDFWPARLPIHKLRLQFLTDSIKRQLFAFKPENPIELAAFPDNAQRLFFAIAYCRTTN